MTSEYRFERVDQSKAVDPNGTHVIVGGKNAWLIPVARDNNPGILCVYQDSAGNIQNTLITNDGTGIAGTVNETLPPEGEDAAIVEKQAQDAFSLRRGRQTTQEILREPIHPLTFNRMTLPKGEMVMRPVGLGANLTLSLPTKKLQSSLIHYGATINIVTTKDGIFVSSAGTAQRLKEGIVYTIGRGEDSIVKGLKFELTSRQHVVVLLAQNILYILDISKNGTLAEPYSALLQ